MRRCGGMADAFDSKSNGKPCEFDSRQRHQKGFEEFFKAFFYFIKQQKKPPAKLVVHD
jgi:hypothetical protein